MPKQKESDTVTNNKIPFKNFIITVYNFFTDGRFLFISGLVLLFFSAFLLLAFTSYLFTWQIDQSKLDLEVGYSLSSVNITVDNWAGKVGALLSNKFIHDWFGIPSFSIIFILFIVGFRFLNYRILPLFKTFKITLLLTIWFSVFLGYTFKDSYFYLGGAHGFFMSQWLNALIGRFGTAAVLFITIVALLIFTVKNALAWIKSLSHKNQTQPPIQLENTDTTTEPQSEQEITQNNDVEFIVEENINPENIADEQPKSILSEDPIEMDDSFIITPAPSNVEMTVEDTTTQPTDAIEEELPIRNYDPTLDLSMYIFPSLDLLNEYKSPDHEVSEEELVNNKNKILKTLNDYKIGIDKIKATIGPTVTLYEIVPSPGVRISKIKNLEDDIALSLAALGIRIIAPMPGKGTIGIEVPNKNPEVVSMRSVISSKKFIDTKFELPIVLGKNISNEVFTLDLTKAPHILVAGSTGQGKSVGLNAIITSLLYKKHPSQLKFVMIDPKKVELTLYSRLEKHFLAKIPSVQKPILTDTQEVVRTLKSLTQVMEHRLEMLENASAKNIKEYNEKFLNRQLNPNKGHEYMPYIVVVIDEFADLIIMAGREVEMPLTRLAQLARAIGIHLIIATQRPSTNIITGTIKANFPTRIAFRVVSMIDSRTILDSPGANQLIGRGDMLIYQGSDLVRLQCPFIDTPEIEAIVNHIATQQSYPMCYELPDIVDEKDMLSDEVMDNGKRDDLFFEAARLIVQHQQGSTSLIQRKFSIGYNRAGRIMDQLEAAGIVGPSEGSKPRQVKFTDMYSLEQFFNTISNNN